MSGIFDFLGLGGDPSQQGVLSGAQSPGTSPYALPLTTGNRVGLFGGSLQDAAAWLGGHPADAVNFMRAQQMLKQNQAEMQQRQAMTALVGTGQDPSLNAPTRLSVVQNGGAPTPTGQQITDNLQASTAAQNQQGNVGGQVASPLPPVDNGSMGGSLDPQTASLLRNLPASSALPVLMARLQAQSTPQKLSAGDTLVAPVRGQDGSLSYKPTYTAPALPTDLGRNAGSALQAAIAAGQVDPNDKTAQAKFTSDWLSQNSPGGVAATRSNAPSPLMKDAQALYPNDPDARSAYIARNSPSNLRQQTFIQNGGGNPAAMVDDPITQSYVTNVLAGNMNMQNVPVARRAAVSMAMANADKQDFSPVAEQRMTTTAKKITDPYTNMSAYKLTADGAPYLARIQAAMKTPGSVSDQDLLDSLTKLNTGGNAVTDAQVALITGGKSYADWAGTIANKFKNGGVLSNNQRQQISQIAGNIYDNYRKGYAPIQAEVEGKLTQAGIPKQFWTIPDLDNLATQQLSNMGLPPSGPGAAATPAPLPRLPQQGAAPAQGAIVTKVIGGVTYHNINGQWMQ